MQDHDWYIRGCHNPLSAHMPGERGRLSEDLVSLPPQHGQPTTGLGRVSLFTG